MRHDSYGSGPSVSGSSGFGPSEPSRGAANLAALFTSIARRRHEEIGKLSQRLLSGMAAYDSVGAEQVQEALKDLVGELAEWLVNGDAKSPTGVGKAESAVELIDPNAPGGVRYELDAISGPYLRAALDELKRADRYRARGAEPPTRMLFDGPAGCGKTQALYWLARGLGKPVASVMLARLLSKWVGETGARFLASIDAAREAGAVLLVDELDAVGSHRTEGDHGGVAQVVGAVNQILEDPKNRDLVIVGATNLPDMIDPAVARRFGMRIRFGYPDVATRERIVHHHWRLAPLGEGALESLVSRTEGRSGDALVRAAHAANRAAGHRGAARADALHERPTEVAAAIRAVVGPWTKPELGARAAEALARIDAAAAEADGDDLGRRTDVVARTASDLLIELERVEVADVLVALAGLTKEVPLDREPSLLVRPGAAGRAP